MSFSLFDLEKIIEQRAASGDKTSWTAKLVDSGIAKAAEKLGEEAVETIVASLTRDQDGLRDEAADLLFHLLVVLHMKDVPLADVISELERRTGQTGLVEKASRSKTETK